MVIEHAALAGNPIELGVSTADALQGCLDRVVALWRHAASEVDALAEDEVFTLLISSTGVANEVPNVWIQHEAELRKEIEHLAATMTGLGIAERRVRIEEAQAALLVASIRDAAVEAGISHDQIRLLGEHLRARLDQSKVDIPPSPRSAHSQSQDPATSRLVASTGPSHGPSGGPDSSPSS